MSEFAAQVNKNIDDRVNKILSHMYASDIAMGKEWMKYRAIKHSNTDEPCHVEEFLTKSKMVSLSKRSWPSTSNDDEPGPVQASSSRQPMSPGNLASKSTVVANFEKTTFVWLMAENRSSRVLHFWAGILVKIAMAVVLAFFECAPHLKDSYHGTVFSRLLLAFAAVKVRLESL